MGRVQNTGCGAASAEAAGGATVVLGGPLMAVERTMVPVISGGGVAAGALSVMLTGVGPGFGGSGAEEAGVVLGAPLMAVQLMGPMVGGGGVAAGALSEVLTGVGPALEASPGGGGGTDGVELTGGLPAGRDGSGLDAAPMSRHCIIAAEENLVSTQRDGKRKSRAGGVRILNSLGRGEYLFSLSVPLRLCRTHPPSSPSHFIVPAQSVSGASRCVSGSQQPYRARKLNKVGDGNRSAELKQVLVVMACHTPLVNDFL